MDIVKFLTGLGAEVNHQDIDGYGPIHQAAREGHVDNARILVGHKAELELQNKDGETPFLLACRFGRLGPYLF